AAGDLHPGEPPAALAVAGRRHEPREPDRDALQFGRVAGLRLVGASEELAHGHVDRPGGRGQRRETVGRRGGGRCGAAGVGGGWPGAPAPDGVTGRVSRTGTPSSSDGSAVCASWARPRNSPMVMSTGPADAGSGGKPSAGGAGGGAARPASRAEVNEPSAGGA